MDGATTTIRLSTATPGVTVPEKPECDLCRGERFLTFFSLKDEELYSIECPEFCVDKPFMSGFEHEEIGLNMKGTAHPERGICLSERDSIRTDQVSGEL